MIRADEFRDGNSQIQFALASLGAKVQPKARPARQAGAVSERALRPGEIVLSGPRVIAGIMFALTFMTLFAWGFVRYWLFAS